MFTVYISVATNERVSYGESRDNYVTITCCDVTASKDWIFLPVIKFDP